MPGRRRQSEKIGAEAAALAWLARRPLTEAELRRRLEEAGHAPPEIEALCRRLTAAGHLDDQRLSRHFVVTRAQRLGHGPRLLVGDLLRRGVPRSVAEGAWRAAIEDGELELEPLLARAIRRRIGAQQGALDQRCYRRVYTALLRAGFPAAATAEALAPYRPPAEVNNDDDFA